MGGVETPVSEEVGRGQPLEQRQGRRRVVALRYPAASIGLLRAAGWSSRRVYSPGLVARFCARPARVPGRPHRGRLC